MFTVRAPYACAPAPVIGIFRDPLGMVKVTLIPDMVTMTVLTLNLSSVYLPAGNEALPRILDKFSTVNRFTVALAVIVCHLLASQTLVVCISILVKVTYISWMLEE